MLCAVQSRVGKFNQLSLEASVISVHRNPDADGDLLYRQQRVGTEARLLDALPNTLRHAQRALGVGLRQNDHKFFAAITGEGVDVPHVSLQKGSDLSEYLVAYMVSTLIVQELETVDVDHEQRQRRAFAFSALDFQIQLLLEVASGAKAGEIVRKRKLKQSLVRASPV